MLTALNEYLLLLNLNTNNVFDKSCFGWTYQVNLKNEHNITQTRWTKYILSQLDMNPGILYITQIKIHNINEYISKYGFQLQCANQSMRINTKPHFEIQIYIDRKTKSLFLYSYFQCFNSNNYMVCICIYVSVQWTEIW